MIEQWIVDINCDMGEGFGAYHFGNDTAIMPYVSSVNIACGFHAGDASVMRKTLESATVYGLKIGAHPGFPDLQGFGRREMRLSTSEIYDIVVYQIGALAAIAKTEGVSLNHVKPHGALYNMAAKDEAMAETIASAIRDVDSNLILYGLSGSASITAGKAIGLKTYNEVFADRTYQPDGSLTARTRVDAMIDDAEIAVAQAIKMVKEQKVAAVDGAVIDIVPETVCIHGDGANALVFARALAEGFNASGITVK